MLKAGATGGKPMFRPAQARWFETYVPRDMTVKATEVLAATGVVQLETDPRIAEPVEEERLRYFVERFRALAAQYPDDLPGTGGQATALVGDPVHLANAARHRLRVWSARVEYLKAHVANLRGELHHLELLAECLQAMRQAGMDLDGVFRKTRFLCKCLFACPRHGGREAATEAATETVTESGSAEAMAGVDAVVRGSRHDFLYIAGLPDQRHAIRHWAVDRGCEQMGIPAWLNGDHAEQVRRLGAHLGRTHDKLAELEKELKALRRDPGVAEARANVDTLHWYLAHAALSLAMLTLAGSVASPWAWGVIVVLGNVFSVAWRACWCSCRPRGSCCSNSSSASCMRKGGCSGRRDNWPNRRPGRDARRIEPSARLPARLIAGPAPRCGGWICPHSWGRPGRRRRSPTCAAGGSSISR